MKTRSSSIKHSTLALCVIFLAAVTSGWAQQTGEATFSAGVPLDNSPNANKQQLTLKLQYLDAAKNLDNSNVTINVGVWNPLNETIFQAQNRKAKAIAAAINAAKLNGVKAVTAQRMGWLQSPINGAWFWGPMLDIKVDGVAKDKKNKNVVSTVLDPTKEGNGGRVQFKGGGGGGGGDSMYSPGMKGTKTGMSSGMNPFGNPSFFSFGFYSNNGQTLDVATLTGVSGWTDSQILGALASQFNSLYSQSGFTASFNPTSDTLSFNQQLDANQDTFYMADTDTGINFNMTLSSTPEPSSLLLFGSAVIGLSGVLRKRLRERS